MANVLDLATELGKALYRCGAETYRIEDTVRRVILALTEEGTEVDVYALPAYLDISICLPRRKAADGAPAPAGNPATTTGASDLATPSEAGAELSGGARILNRSLRMSGVSYNLAQLEEINALSWQVTRGEVGLEQAYARLREITEPRPQVWWKEPLSYGCVAAGFSLMLGAPWGTLPYPFVLGILLALALRPLKIRGFNRTLSNTYGAFLVTFCVWALAYFDLLHGSHHHINVAVLMNLVPGLLLTNGARDLMSGDTGSGMANLMEAVLAAIALALGSGMALYLWQLIDHTLI